MRGSKPRCGAAGAVALLIGVGFGGAAAATQYEVRAAAGSVEHVQTSPDEPLAAASFSRAPVGAIDSYGATANLATGTLFATSSISNGAALDFVTVEAGSTASFDETLRFEQSLAGPVTVTAHLVPALFAEAPSVEAGSSAKAEASFEFELAGCIAKRKTTNGTPVDTLECPNAAHGWQATPDTVTVVIDPAVFPGVTELDLDGEVQAEFEDPTHIVSGNTSASLAIGITIEPPVAHSYLGSQTAFPAPEPSAATLGAFASGALAMLLRRRARRNV